MNRNKSECGSSPGPRRLAVISTPRSGNTWVRSLLADLYQLPERVVHSPDEVDWDRLPPDAALQLHWRRVPEVLDLFQRYGFRVVTVARHPLDVLISILHFTLYDSETDRWLEGAGGTEGTIRGAMPRSRPFVEYARGPRAAALMGVTCDWWTHPGALSLRYEDLVANPEAELARVAEALGPPPNAAWKEVLERCSIESMRSKTWNNHYWKGQPGLWRKLLTAAEVAEIAPALADFCGRFGYECDADPGLTASAADAAWVRLIGDELTRTLRNLRDDSCRAAEREQAALARLARYESIAGFPLQLASHAHSLREKYPRLYRAVHRMVGPGARKAG